MNFRVGQKVVCVDAESFDDGWAPLTSGVIYTIRATTLGLDRRLGPNTPGVYLVEVRNNPSAGAYELAYRSARFRPLVEKKTDISIFRKIDADVFGKVRA